MLLLWQPRADVGRSDPPPQHPRNTSLPLADVRLLFSPSCFPIDVCQVLADTMENTPRLRPIWSAFKPLLQGKVLYTPDTPAALRLITEVKPRRGQSGINNDGNESDDGGVAWVDGCGDGGVAWVDGPDDCCFLSGQRHLRRSGPPQGAAGAVGRAGAARLGLLPG